MRSQYETPPLAPSGGSGGSGCGWVAAPTSADPPWRRRFGLAAPGQRQANCPTPDAAGWRLQLQPIHLGDDDWGLPHPGSGKRIVQLRMRLGGGFNEAFIVEHNLRLGPKATWRPRFVSARCSRRWSFDENHSERRRACGARWLAFAGGPDHGRLAHGLVAESGERFGRSRAPLPREAPRQEKVRPRPALQRPLPITCGVFSEG
jgi:hypothetical protein